MRKLLVLVGLQGAGKTTALHSVANAKVLRSSTSRAPRAGESPNDYYFEGTWDPQLMAWQLDFGTSKYGMRRLELDSVTDIGITVFEPGSMQVLEAAKPALNFEIITIGLDTLQTLNEQHMRVNNEPKRVIANQQEFDRQRTAVLECDAVLSGDAGVVAQGIEAVIRSIGGRGGLLDSETIKKFVAAGALLTNAKPAQIEPASYDLTLADKYWCQGQYIEVKNNEIVRIPAYSFVFVTAQEEACLPRFIGGSFDLTVSMFFDGVILSNGPQVDPGYRGALFCMLYNTTDEPVALNRGFKFATMQFSTTTRVSPGYTGQYQRKSTFQDFVRGRVAISPGGKILERLTAVEKSLRDEYEVARTEMRDAAKTVRTDFYTWFGVVASITLALAGYAYTMADKANSAADKATGASDKANAVVERSDSSLKKLEERLEKLEKTAASNGKKSTAAK
jgi:deoxycytidine triphosphate deaminase/guanylate kinase